MKHGLNMLENKGRVLVMAPLSAITWIDSEV